MPLLYDLVCAMLYALVNGVRWRDLPHDLPPWTVVYYHFRRWQRLSVWTVVVETLAAHARQQAGHGAPKHLAVDSPSAPTTPKGGRGYEGGKKIKGRDVGAQCAVPLLARDDSRGGVNSCGCVGRAGGVGAQRAVPVLLQEVLPKYPSVQRVIADRA